jgi:hypothetical protein
MSLLDKKNIMKKIVRLTESDLNRIVKRVIREQEEDGVRFERRRGASVFSIKNKSKEGVDRLLSNLNSYPNYIAILDCEYFDINKHENLICGNDDLMILNLVGTPNNMRSSKCAMRKLDEVAPGVWDATLETE